MAYTKSSDWKKSTSIKPSDLELPSGNVALVRAPGIQLFLQLGFIPNSLIGYVKAALDENSGKSDNAKAKMQEDKFMREVLSSPDKLDDLVGLADRVTLYCVEKPELHATPTKTVEIQVDGETVEKQEPDFDACDPELLYVHEVDFDDKMFIMNFAFGGTRSVDGFRGELTSVVGGRSTGKKVVKKTKRTGGATGKPKSKKR